MTDVEMEAEFREKIYHILTKKMLNLENEIQTRISERLLMLTSVTIGRRRVVKTQARLE